MSNAKLQVIREIEPAPAVSGMKTDKNGGVNYLKNWREYRAMTQEELAEAVGTTGTQISMLESGQRGLTAKWLRRLASKLGTKPGYLLDQDPHAVPNDVLEILMTASSTNREIIIDIIRAISSREAANI